MPNSYYTRDEYSFPSERDQIVNLRAKVSRLQVARLDWNSVVSTTPGQSSTFTIICPGGIAMWNNATAVCNYVKYNIVVARGRLYAASSKLALLQVVGFPKYLLLADVEWETKSVWERER